MVLERLKSVEAAIAAVASIAAIALQYFVIPSVVTIPDNVSPLYQFLTTGLLVILVFVTVILLQDFAKSKVISQVLVILALAGLGVWAGVSLVNQITEQSHTMSCRDFEGSRTILVTNAPSPELKDLLEVAGSVERGWCNHQQKLFFRALVEQESIPTATRAGLRLLASQLLLALALIVGGLLFVKGSRSGD